MVLDAHGLEQEAAVCYSEAVRLAPKDWRWPYLHATVMSTLEPAAAVPSFQRAIELAPTQPVLRERYGHVLLQVGRNDDARVQFQRALEQEQTRRRSWLGLAEIAIKEGRPERALELLNRAAALEFQDREVHAKLARVYDMLGQTEQARREALLTRAFPDLAPILDSLRAAVDGLAVSSTAQTERGLAAVARRRYVEAEKAFREVLRTGKVEARHYLNLGGALAGQGRLNEALVELRRALELEPEGPLIHNTLAGALADAGRLDQAEHHARTALQIDSKSDEAHYNLGHVFQKRGDFDSAIQSYRKALELNPVNSLAHNNLAIALEQRSRIDDALHHWREAVTFGRANAEASFNLATRLATRGRFGEAVNLLRQGLIRSPDDANLMMALATILATCPDAGARDGREALRLSKRLGDIRGPDHIPTIMLEAASYAETGDFANAIRLSERALELAQAGGSQGTARQIMAQLTLFRSDRPYHQGPQ